MRLSEWRKRAPAKDSVSPKVTAIVDAALVMLGAGPDPDCWVAWGDDPAIRYLILAPTPSGLVQLNVRVNVPGEGPRASGKVVRWGRVQLGELGVEMQGGHRLISFQVESQVLNGVDVSAEAIAQFAQVLFAAIDGRAVPTATAARSSRAKPGSKAGAKTGSKAGATRSASTRVPAAGAAAAKPRTAKPPLRLSAAKGT